MLDFAAVGGKVVKVPTIAVPVCLTTVLGLVLEMSGQRSHWTGNVDWRFGDCVLMGKISSSKLDCGYLMNAFGGLFNWSGAPQRCTCLPHYSAGIGIANVWPKEPLDGEGGLEVWRLRFDGANQFLQT